MSDHAHGHSGGHDGHGGNGLGDIGSQETVTVIALAVTVGITVLMLGLLVASRFI